MSMELMNLAAPPRHTSGHTSIPAAAPPEHTTVPYLRNLCDGRPEAGGGQCLDVDPSHEDLRGGERRMDKWRQQG